MSRLSVFLFGAAVLTSVTATAMDEATYTVDAVNGHPAGTWTGCQPYSIYPCGSGRNVCIEEDPDTPECSVTSCTRFTVDDAYTLTNAEEAIMTEIYEHGPVQAIFNVYTDFMYYKSGIYQYTRGKIEGSHAIKILGWDVENGVKYWLCANSWSRTWGGEGENGKFRMLRGNDECGIE